MVLPGEQIEGTPGIGAYQHKGITRASVKGTPITTDQTVSVLH